MPRLQASLSAGMEDTYELVTERLVGSPGSSRYLFEVGWQLSSNQGGTTGK